MPITASQREELRRWLATTLDVSPHDLSIEPLAVSGDSNLMFEISGGGRRLVLRVPPRVKNDASAHDVLREYRMLVALDQTDIPHPSPVAACDQSRPLGSPFFVMEHVPGFSPNDPLPEPWASRPASRRGLGLEAAAGLARLSQIPWQEIGLGEFGRPDGFLARQVSRWMRQLERYKVRELDGLAQVARWLEDHRPPDAPPAIVHGDFHLRNVMFASEPPARVRAIVDWEMATIGDPLLDFGSLLGTWSEPGEDVFMNGSVTQWDGMATREELAEAYANAGGRPLDHIPYYMALALFKLACILEGSHARLLAGDSEHPGHAVYDELVPRIVRRAVDVTTGALTVRQEPAV